ncbi:MAG: SDR family oxidoreductase [Burkholderiaceae bacterium]|nr:SDR family oxidoreductase [Burkholderiaceae bacterium]
MGKRLEGKVAMIVGAGSVGPGWGNGKAASLRFAQEGASVFAVDIRREAADETRAIIESEGGVAVSHAADVTRGESVRNMVQACEERFGRIDILVNNVGIAVLGGPVEQSEDDWDRVMDTNVKSMFLTCKHVLPVMEKNGAGSIVNISSIASLRWAGVPYVSYSASKAAVNQLTSVVAMQYARKGIRVNAILPGLIKTPMIVEPLKAHYGNVDEMMRIRNEMCPTGSMGEAWDVANAALFLASDEARYITGTELIVDGGLHCQVAAPAG